MEDSNFSFSVSTRYNVSEASLWEYLALVLHNSRESKLDDRLFNRSVPVIESVYEAIEKLDGFVYPKKLVEEATFQNEDFFVKGLKDLWSSCAWFGHNDAPCNDSTFRSIFTRHGRCLVFNHQQNGTDILLQLKEGPENGFNGILDIHPEESCGNVMIYHTQSHMSPCKFYN